MYCPYCAVDYTPEESCFCYPPPKKQTSASKPEAKGPWGEAAEGWSSESDLTAEPLPETVRAGPCIASSSHVQVPVSASHVKGPWGEAAPAWSFDGPVNSRFPDTITVEDCRPKSTQRKRVDSRPRVEGPWGEAAVEWSLKPETATQPVPDPVTVEACYRRVALPLKRTCITPVRARVAWGDAAEAWSLESDVTTDDVTKPP